MFLLCLCEKKHKKRMATRAVPLLELEFSPLCSWREHALERDIEIEGQIRLQVVVGLIAAGRRKRLGRHGARLAAGLVRC